MVALVYFIGLLALGAALGVVVVGVTPPWMKPEAVQEEAVKVAIQVLVFGLAGGAVKFLLDRQAALRSFRSDMLERLGSVHKVVYRVRRLLPLCAPEDRPQLLGELMDAREVLGGTGHATRIWRYGICAEQIESEIRVMRAYLEEVIDAASVDPDDPAHIAYTTFVNLKDETEYKRRFKRRYFAAKKLIDPMFAPPPADDPAQDSAPAPKQAFVAGP